MKILVTGASGLLGGDLLPILMKRFGRPFTAARTELDHPNHTVVDLVDPDATRSLLASISPDAIVHLAGGNPPELAELYMNNVLTTVNLLQAAGEIGIHPYCIVTGSAAEYGEVEGDRIDEHTPLRPVSDYGRAKAAQTTLAQPLAHRAAVPLTIVRPFNIVSPHLPTSSALGNIRDQLLSQSGADRHIRCGRLDVVRDFVPLRIVTETIARLIEVPVPGHTINICSGIALQLGKVVEAMAAQLGVRLVIEPVPELIQLPAAHQAVGDPTALRELVGVSFDATAEFIADALLAGP